MNVNIYIKYNRKIKFAYLSLQSVVFLEVLVWPPATPPVRFFLWDCKKKLPPDNELPLLDHRLQQISLPEMLDWPLLVEFHFLEPGVRK